MIIESDTEKESSEDKITDSEVSESSGKGSVKQMPCLQLFSVSNSQIHSIYSGIKGKEAKPQEEDSSDLADSFDSEVEKKFEE